MKKKNNANYINKNPELAPELEEKRVGSEIVFKGEFLNLYKDRVIASDGHSGVREYFSHPGAVAILPFLTNKTLLLERQWRYPLGKSMLEVPAGKIDPNEEPKTARHGGHSPMVRCRSGNHVPVRARTFAKFCLCSTSRRCVSHS